MSVDGFAVKTTIAQMGNVAKTQLKSQQTHSSTDAINKQIEKKDNRLDRVSKAEEAQKTQINPDEHKDRHKRRGRDGNPQDDLSDEQTETDAGNDGGEDGLGSMVDLKA